MKKKYFGCISRHFLVTALVLLLVFTGPTLIAIDLIYLTEWAHSLQIVDFYTYLSFIGIASVWSIFGFIVLLMRNIRGFTIYTIVLCFLSAAHFIIGFVHIMLLFTTYRPVFVDTCLQRQPSRYFWWSLGYEDNQEMEQIYKACSTQWNRFATERLLSWIGCSLITLVCLYFVVKYQLLITHHQRNKAQGKMIREWSDDEDDFNLISNNIEKKDGITVQHATYYGEEFPPASSPRVDNELTVNMYQQRQKLFDEIAKRKRARKNINRKSFTSNTTSGGSQQSSSSNRDSTLVVHPLDLAQDPEVYQPPPMPPPADANKDENWNRYHDNLLREEQEAIERQKRVDTLSTERMEYEMYRSNTPSSRKSSLQSEVVKKEASRRKRPTSVRWSSYNSESRNTFQPLSCTSEEEHKYGEKTGGEGRSTEEERMPAAHEEEEEEEEEEEGEDTYNDIQPEEPSNDDDDEEDSSLLMKPSQEEKID